MDFIKYHSLGNDIILVDRYLSNEKGMQFSSQSIQGLCNRHYGVGADGVIVLEKKSDNKPIMHVFNADGSQAETCFNGLRCVADYLYRTHHFPEQFTIQTGAEQALCTILPTESDGWKIRSETKPVLFLGQRNVKTSQGLSIGYAVCVGNPHFVIFQHQSKKWIEEHCHEIESHALFPQKTNVEFVSPSPLNQDFPAYDVLVYERGCGITLACGSGAAAVAGVLIELERIQKEQKFYIHMPGGSLTAFVTQRNSIILEASVTQVFRGQYLMPL